MKYQSPDATPCSRPRCDDNRSVHGELANSGAIRILATMRIIRLSCKTRAEGYAQSRLTVCCVNLYGFGLPLHMIQAERQVRHVYF